MVKLKLSVTTSDQWKPEEIDLSNGVLGANIGNGKAVISKSDFDNVLTAKIPSHLYHYTTSDGFIGIVDSGSIWATNYHYLNDSLEYRYFFGLVKAAVDRINGKKSVGTSEGEYFKSDYLFDGAEFVFISSFSENPDQLSQWRGYAEGGYSVGFPRSVFKSLNSNGGLFLAKCIYCEKTATEVAEKLAEYFCCEFSKEKDQNRQTRLRNSFVRLTARLAPFFKHKAFEEEAEWRIFSLKGPDDHKDVFRRSSSTGLVSYIKVPIFEHLTRSQNILDGTPLEHLKIVASPGVSGSFSKAEPVRMIRSVQKINAWCEESSIPYRLSQK